MYEQLLEEASSLDTPPERLSQLFLWREDQEIAKRLKLCLAKNPSTPPEILEKLSLSERSKENPIFVAVGANPNAPLKALYTVWSFAPESFLENTAAPLFELESPQFWDEMPNHTLSALISLPNIGPRAMYHAAKRNDEYMLTRLLRNPNIPSELLRDIANRSNYRRDFWREAASNPRLPLDLVPFLFGHRELDIRRAIAQNPSLPAPLKALIPKLPKFFPKADNAPVEELSQEELFLLSRFEGFQDFVASHPRCPSRLLALLALGAKHPEGARLTEADPELLSRLTEPGLQFHNGRAMIAAAHPNASEALIRVLATYSHIQLRSCIAQRQDLPPDLLLQLTQDRQIYVRAEAAKHPNLTTETVCALSQDKAWAVRRSTVTHPKLPPELLCARARDTHYEVRLAVARCASTPRAALSELLEDEHEAVRNAARQNPSTDKDALERLSRMEGASPRIEDLVSFAEGGPYAKELVARSAATPLWLLEQLAKSPKREARCCAAAAVNATSEMLEALSNDESVAVRIAVAKNPKAPLSCLWRLLSSEQTALLIALSQNPALPEELWTALLDRELTPIRAQIAKNPGAPKAVLRSLSERLPAPNNCSVLRLIARRADAPVEAFIKLNGKHSREIAQNPAFLSLPQTEPGSITEMPVNLLREMLQQKRPLSEEMLRWFAKHPSQEVQCLLAQNPKTPQDLLLALSESDHKAIQKALRKNPKAPRPSAGARR